MSQVVAQVDRDYLNEKWNKEGGEYGSDNRVGTNWSTKELSQYSEWELETSPLPADTSRFRLKDDDGEIYYGGWLYDDPGCNVQMIVLEWGTWDSGCTTIEVKRNGEWVQDIG